MRLSYLDVTVQADEADGVVVANVTGLVTEVSAAQIIGDARKWAKEPLAQVVSYRDSRVGLCASTLFKAAQRAHASSTPTALVVPAGQYEMFRTYVQMHVAQGIHKAAFISESEARRWAAEQAAVQDYWRRLERSRRSFP